MFSLRELPLLFILTEKALAIALVGISLHLLLFCGNSVAMQFEYSCKISEHFNDDGSLKPEGRYQYFICTGKKKTKKAIAQGLAQTLPASTATVSLELSSTEQLTEPSPEYEEELNSVADYITITNIHPAPSAVHLQVIAIANTETEEVKIENSHLPASITEEVLATSIQRFRVAPSYQANPVSGAAIAFDAPAIQLNPEKFKRAKKTFDKLLEDLKETEFQPEVPSWVAKLWPLFKTCYQSITNFVPIGGVAISAFSFAYNQPIRDSVATFEEQPKEDFTGCRVNIIVNTEELLRDMYRQRVLIFNETLPRRSSASKIGEILESLNGPEVSVFQTTGVLAGFADGAENCNCPICPATGRRSARSFDGCLVDVTVQTDVILANALGLVHSNFDEPPLAILIMEGYFENINDTCLSSLELNDTCKDLTFTTDDNCFKQITASVFENLDDISDTFPNSSLKVRAVTQGNFTSFDVPPGFIGNSPCSCEECPRVQTESSQLLGNFLVVLTNTAVGAVSVLMVASLWYAIKKTFLKRP